MLPSTYHPRLMLIAVIALLGSITTEASELEIVIGDGLPSASPIAVIPFAWRADGPDESAMMAKVIGNDLARSGQFSLLAERDMVERPSRISDVQFGTWRRLSVDYLLLGEVEGSELDGYDVNWRLVNVRSGESQLNISFRTRSSSLRYTAHHIADEVFESVTGIRGAFRTRIAYITAAGAGDDRVYALMVADADGFNPQAVVRSREPLLSPAWSPDGSHLAYVSFEEGNSSIWMQEIATGSRRKLASFKGINGAPNFSPEGNRLALTLSRTGSPEIYIMDLSSKRLKQLTTHWAIDTEPVWDTDGRSILFTSDRGGKPQIYTVDVVGDGNPRRVTRRGDYNAKVALSPDGKRMAMVHGNDNDYRIAILHREDETLHVVSDGPLDESPSFAPNGSMLLYASRNGSQGVLSAVPVLGVTLGTQTAHQLIFAEGDIREPAWSPYRP